MCQTCSVHTNEYVCVTSDFQLLRKWYAEENEEHIEDRWQIKELFFHKIITLHTRCCAPGNYRRFSIRLTIRRYSESVGTLFASQERLFAASCHSLAVPMVSVVGAVHDRKMLETIRCRDIRLSTKIFNLVHEFPWSKICNFLFLLQSVCCSTTRKSYEATAVALNSGSKPFHHETISGPKSDFVWMPWMFRRMVNCRCMSPILIYWRQSWMHLDGMHFRALTCTN